MLSLSGDTTGFDIQNAYACAYASRIVYISPEQIADEVANALDLNSFRLVHTPTLQGFVAAGKTATLVTFQGSERDFDDWAGNMKAAFIPGPFGQGERVHRGFGKALNGIFDEVRANIEALENPGAPLFITGHSCGAAFATLLAARFLSADRDFHSLYTFGSPRVGCRRFRDIYEHLDKQRTFRVVNRHDIVARIPPRLMRYRHVGALRYLDADGDIHEDLNFWQRAILYMDPGGRTAKSYVGDLVGRLPGAFEDHRMTSYLAKLERHAEPSSIA